MASFQYNDVTFRTDSSQISLLTPALTLIMRRSFVEWVARSPSETGEVGDTDWEKLEDGALRANAGTGQNDCRSIDCVNAQKAAAVKTWPSECICDPNRDE